MSLTAETVCPLVLDRRQESRPQLLNVLRILLSVAIGSEINQTAGGALGAAIPSGAQLQPLGSARLEVRKARTQAAHSKSRKSN